MLLDAAPEALLLVDQTGRIVLVNAQSAALFGCAQAELVGQPVENLFPGSCRSACAAVRAPAAVAAPEQLAGQGAVLRCRRRNGVEIPVELRMRPTPDGQFTAVALREVAGLQAEPDDDKHRERRREPAPRWLHTVLDQCPVGIVLLHGAHGEPIEVNTYAQQLLGDAAPGLARGADLQLVDEQGPLLGARHPGARALSGEPLTGLTLALRTASGEHVPILLNAAPIKSESGEVQGAVVVFQNITFLKQLERLRAEWNAVIAHDLRQPLNAIALNVQMLARKTKNTAELGRPVEMISCSARRLNRMIGDLLDLSRLELQQLTLSPQPTDLASLINASVEHIAAEMPERKFAVCLAELPDIELDARRVERVFEALLSSAVKYGDAEAPIAIAAAMQGESVGVTITVPHSGLPADNLQDLCLRLHHPESSERGPMKGGDLGLYIAQQLMQAHGGHIEARTTAGVTTLRLTLPRARQSLPAARF